MDHRKKYSNFLKNFINITSPITVVLDASNGPSGLIVKDLFKDININAIVMNDNIDPDFSAHGPNPLVQGACADCASMIIKEKACGGVVFDADGDRAIFLDEKGFMLPAHIVAMILFSGSKPPYVVDELVYQSLRMCNLIPVEYLLPTRVGSYFLKEEIVLHKASVGAEYSGHYYFSDFFNADSGILAAIKVLNYLSKSNKPLSKIVEGMGENLIFSAEVASCEIEQSLKFYKDLEDRFKPQTKAVEKRDGVTFLYENFWLNVRLSNTEPLVRITGGGSLDEVEKFNNVVDYVRFVRYKY